MKRSAASGILVALAGALLVTAGEGCGAAPVASGSGPGAPAPTPDAPAPWTELRLAWDFRSCPHDGSSCHQSLVVGSKGDFIASEASDAASEPARRFSSLMAPELHAVRRVVEAPGFVDRMATLGCPAASEPRVTLAITGAWGVKKADVGGCVRDASASEAHAAVRTLVETLAPHRFASHDGPPIRPVLGGEGDPCSSNEQCDKGFVCAIAPCVVAPCTSGTCQRGAR